MFDKRRLTDHCRPLLFGSASESHCVLTSSLLGVLLLPVVPSNIRTDRLPDELHACTGGCCVKWLVGLVGIPELHLEFAVHGTCKVLPMDNGPSETSESILRQGFKIILTNCNYFVLNK